MDEYYLEGNFASENYDDVEGTLRIYPCQNGERYRFQFAYDGDYRTGETEQYVGYFGKSRGGCKKRRPNFYCQDISEDGEQVYRYYIKNPKDSGIICITSDPLSDGFEEIVIKNEDVVPKDDEDLDSSEEQDSESEELVVEDGEGEESPSSYCVLM